MGNFFKPQGDGSAGPRISNTIQKVSVGNSLRIGFWGGDQLQIGPNNPSTATIVEEPVCRFANVRLFKLVGKRQGNVMVEARNPSDKRVWDYFQLAVGSQQKTHGGADDVPTSPSGPIASNVARPTNMRESAWRYLLQFTAKHEWPVFHMYNNRKAGSTAQDVSCGIGFRIDKGAETHAWLMALFFDPATHQTPTPKQMKADWDAAAAHDRTNTTLAQYAQLCSMRMHPDRTYDQMALILRDQKLPRLLSVVNSKTGKKDYKDFASFPAAAQVFCLSFAYGRIPIDFPNMGTAIGLGQWKVAATQCHVIGWSETKQAGHRRLLQFAQDVVDQGRNFDEVPPGIL